jgi:hypothetical protein
MKAGDKLTVLTVVNAHVGVSAEPLSLQLLFFDLPRPRPRSVAGSPDPQPAPSSPERSILTWWRTRSAFDSRQQGCGFDSLSRQTFCFLYLCAQAFSASLKRSLHLSANKHYYY